MPENNNSCSFRTSIGGQALMEGILMRGPKKQAIVCRTVELCQARGFTPELFSSANTEGGDEKNAAHLEKYKPLVKAL